MALEERPRDGVADGVAVVGAGIVGLSSAVFLRRGGASVTVFDPLPPPGGASYGNAGLLSVDSCVPISLPGMLWKVPRWLMDPLGPLAVDPRYVVKAAPWLLKWARAGRMRCVLAASDALRGLHKPALEQYRELLGAEYFHDLIRTSGQIHVWDGGPESAGERVSRLIRERHGIVAEPLDPNELHQFVPEITPEIGRALFYPNNGQTVN
ncbi:MAG: FAD-dependent oxidoreductase, partial [Steroidobacteraceae bacterium]